MQYCTKCHNILENEILVCPFCKKTKTIRKAQDDDKVFLMKCSEYEALDIKEKLEQNLVECQVKNFSMGFVSSLYDSEIMPNDKIIFVDYKNIEKVKDILSDEDEAEELSEENIPLDKKSIGGQIILTIIFLLLVTGTVLFSDFIAGFIKSLFS